MTETRNKSRKLLFAHKKRSNRSDFGHLLVIFSESTKMEAYNFHESSIELMGYDILWIEDRGNERLSFCTKTRSIVNTGLSVNKIILETLAELKLTKDNCTISGLSKSANFALYVGIKYGYKNILATAPRFQSRARTKKYWKSTIRVMANGGWGREGNPLSNLIKKEIQIDTLIKRNIYLLSPPIENKFQTKTLPKLRLFEKYDNFNLIVSETLLLGQNNDAVQYSLPIIQSVVISLVEGFEPRFGKVTSGAQAIECLRDEKLISDQRNQEEMVMGVDQLNIHSGKLYISGYAFARGYSAASYGEVSTALILSTQSGEVETVSLGGIRDKEFSQRFFQGAFCDYTVAKFTTRRNAGIDLKFLDPGSYKLSVKASHGGLIDICDELDIGAVEGSTESGGKIFWLSRAGKYVLLNCSMAISSTSAESLLELENYWTRDERLHVQGTFAIDGLPTSDWNDVDLSLLIVDSSSGLVRMIRPLVNAQSYPINEIIHDSVNGYSEYFFTTKSSSGVNIAGLPPGHYTLHVGSTFLSTYTTRKLSISMNVVGKFVKKTDLPMVGIIGSCVSRDNFSSKVFPRWREFYKLHGAQYQMSLISLMSQAENLSESAFGDLDDHSRLHTFRDFQKTYLAELRSSPPDVLIVDLRADARFGCIRTDNGFVTDNIWKLRNSKEYDNYKKLQKISYNLNRIEFMEAFEDSVVKFNNFCTRYLPNTIIILNRARAVEGYYRDGVFDSFSRGTQVEMNLKWEALEGVFLSVVDARTIDMPDTQIFSSSDHPWGPGPVHYESAYYESFNYRLLKSLDYSYNYFLE